MPPERLPPAPLTTTTMTTLRRFFDAAGHYPSVVHWQALEAIARTMEAMADGDCPPKVLLSACDPGVGKSQTVIHFAQALSASPDHGHVGMLVCVGRISEAAELANALADQRDRVAVLTADPPTNALSGCDPAYAPILITTQQRIEKATGGRSFEEVETFHFRGSPRAIRCWDEAWLPGVAITLTADAMGFALPPMRAISSDATNALLELMVELNKAEDGQAITVPDFETTFGASLADVLAAVPGGSDRLRDDQRMAITALMALNGRVARVKRDGKVGAVLSYRNTIPDDLMPLLVLDASGRVRETYAYVEKHRGTLERLPSATKNYAPLTIRIWKKSGAKSGFAKHGGDLVKGIVETILTAPDEDWLVVTHKQGGRVRNVEQLITDRLPAKVRDRVKFLPWGQHMATNRYADVGRVILAGTLFMPQSFYTALTHLAQDRDVAPGLVSQEEVAKTMIGEHSHMILQALCRGRVRKSNGDRCQPMQAYVIASPQSGIPAALTDVFPGSRVVRWNPLKPILRGKPRAAFEAVKAALDSGAEWVSYGALANAIRVERTNLGCVVLNRAEWKEAIARLGLVERKVGRAKGLTRATTEAEASAAEPKPANVIPFPVKRDAELAA